MLNNFKSPDEIAREINTPGSFYYKKTENKNFFKKLEWKAVLTYIFELVTQKEERLAEAKNLEEKNKFREEQVLRERKADKAFTENAIKSLDEQAKSQEKQADLAAKQAETKGDTYFERMQEKHKQEFKHIIEESKK